MHDTCPDYLILGVIVLIILSKRYKLRSSSSYSFLQLPTISTLFSILAFPPTSYVRCYITCLLNILNCVNILAFGRCSAILTQCLEKMPG
jgi:hypothetical protein